MFFVKDCKLMLTLATGSLGIERHVSGRLMSRPKLLILVLLLLVAQVVVGAEQSRVQGVRVWTDPGKTRLVFDTSEAVVHRVFPLDQPDRLVIDLENVQVETNLPKVDRLDPYVIGLRGGVIGDTHLRIVVDLKQPVRAKSFVLTPNERYGHRLMIDLTARDGSSARRVSLPSFSDPKTMLGSKGAKRGETGAVIVAIDAGHGGEDPGAIGASGTLEKDVTLAVARQLAKLMGREPALQPLMIRDGDYFVGLRERIEIAREHRADLFVSIHADAFTNTTASGSSVYTLSHGGASSAAANWIAERENSADEIGGVPLAPDDDVLATVLMDMTRNATMEHSIEAASLVLANLRRLGSVHKNYVQRAEFVVLQAPDIPSVLVETAFISNPDEERRLQEQAHQRKLAEAILAGIEAYFRRFPQPGTLLAENAKPASAPQTTARVETQRDAAGAAGGREYVISAGDTLSGIAKRHRVSLSALRARNGLTDDMIHIGQVLTIPEDS